MKNTITFKVAGRRFMAPRMTPAAVVGAVVFSLTGITTRAAREYNRARVAAWHDHAAGLQNEIDAARGAGFAFRYIDGRRVDR